MGDEIFSLHLKLHDYECDSGNVVLNGKILATAINLKTGRFEIPDALKNLLGERFPYQLKKKSHKQELMRGAS